MTTKPHNLPVTPAARHPAVVALHSSASTGGQWKTLGTLLAARRRVMAPDLPGYGTTAGAFAADAPASLAGDAVAVLQAVGGEAQSLHLVGHSYGGAVALKIALMQPQRVLSLTLIEPVVFHLLLHGGGDVDMRLYRGILGIRDRLRGAIAAGWPAYGMAAFVDFWNGAGSWERADAEQRQRLAAQAPAVLRNFAALLGESWPLEEVARLTMPLLTVVGSESPAVTRQLVDKLVDTAPEVTAARIFGAGHMAPVTHASAVSGLIERHVRLAEERESAATRHGFGHSSAAA